MNPLFCKCLWLTLVQTACSVLLTASLVVAEELSDTVVQFRQNTRYCHITKPRRTLNISHARHIDADRSTGNVYLTAGHPDQLHCLDQHGIALWVRALPEAGGVAVGKGVVYVSSAQGSLGVLMFEASNGGYIGASLLHKSYTDLTASSNRLFALSSTSIDVYSITDPHAPKLIHMILYNDPARDSSLNITTSTDGYLLVTSKSLVSPAVFNGEGRSITACCVQLKRRVTLPHAVYVRRRQLAVTEPSRGQLACSIESQGAPIDAAIHPLGDIWVTSSTSVAIY